MTPPATDTRARLLGALRAGVYAVLFLPLYVTPSLLFPYVTGRNFAFRIVVELLLVPLAALWAMSTRDRPRLSPLMVGFLVFVASVAVADIIGIDLYRSFWSTYQRMEGFLGLIHVLLFFVVLTVAFETRQQWTRYFTVSIAVSSLVALAALFQFITMFRAGTVMTPRGTIGNSGILAAYLMMHVFLCALVAPHYQRPLARALLVASASLDIAIVYISGSRSPVVALAVAAFGMAAATWGRRVLRIPRAWPVRTALLVAAAGIAAFVLTQGIPFQENFQRATVGAGQSSREVVWTAAWRTIRDRLWTGWGQENFVVGWDRYYIAAAQNFDRAHSMPLEWMLVGGVPVLATYVALMLLAAWTIWQGTRDDRRTRRALGGLLAAYVLFGLFWFETLETQVVLVSVMAFGEWCRRGSAASDASVQLRRWRPLAIAVSAAAVVAAGAAIYALNVRPLLPARDVVSGLNAWNERRDIVETRMHFENAFADARLRSPEAIEQMAALVPQVVALGADRQPAEVKRFADRAIRELVTLTSRPNVEAKHLRLLGAVYGSASRLEPAYRPQAIETFDRALALSPNNEQTYEAIAGFYAAEGAFGTALAMQDRAIQLAPRDPVLQLGRARIAFRAGVATDGDRAAARAYIAAQRNLVPIAAGYLRTGDWELALMSFEELMRRDPANAQVAAQYRLVLNRLRTQTRSGAGPNQR